MRVEIVMQFMDDEPDNNFFMFYGIFTKYLRILINSTKGVLEASLSVI